MPYAVRTHTPRPSCRLAALAFVVEELLRTGLSIQSSTKEVGREERVRFHPTCPQQVSMPQMLLQFSGSEDNRFGKICKI